MPAPIFFLPLCWRAVLAGYSADGGCSEGSSDSLQGYVARSEIYSLGDGPGRCEHAASQPSMRHTVVLYEVAAQNWKAAALQAAVDLARPVGGGAHEVPVYYTSMRPSANQRETVWTLR